MTRSTARSPENSATSAPAVAPEAKVATATTVVVAVVTVAAAAIAVRVVIADTHRQLDEGRILTR